MAMARYSVLRAKMRIQYERKKRAQLGPEAESAAEAKYNRLVGRLRTFQSNCTQVAADRPLSSVQYAPGSHPQYLATSSWSGDCHIWATASTNRVATLSPTSSVGERMTDVCWHPGFGRSNAGGVDLVTASADASLSLWRLPSLGTGVPADFRPHAAVKDEARGENKEVVSDRSDNEDEDEDMGTGTAAGSGGLHALGSHTSVLDDGSARLSTPLATLRGHRAALTRVAFHPSGAYVGSASHDGTC
jgi:WD40 repeat protein